ncbi:MAG TPA: ferritin-like domain-containing protein [Chitinophagaceae bacterium]|jgi:ferritin-like metal-binding protein YciE|nr:ferritin-like domain-containing protein [Chitinophagaceae bacterium]
MENTTDSSFGLDKSLGSLTNPNANRKGSHSLLKEFFVEELQDIYWAEQHIVDTLPKMIKAATTTQLKSAFENHLNATLVHVSRLEKVFSLLDEKATGKKCKAIAGITNEGEGIIDDTDANTLTRDVGLIFAGQKVEHYEIATYGCLTQLAKTLGRNDIAEILHETLVDEKAADQLLTDIAKNNINVEASMETES